MKGAEQQSVDLQWQQEQDLQHWDSMLARLGGHPLQSALWGESRRLAEAVEYHCFAGYRSGEIAALARVEIRRVPMLGRVAWIPRGPIVVSATDIMPTLLPFLRERHFILAASTPWQQVDDAERQTGSPRTIWIDLTVGKEQLLQNLDSQWRYGAKRALREGVSIEQVSTREAIGDFYHLCLSVSQTKGFRLPASLALMQQLLAQSHGDAPVQARLFAARYQEQMIAGAFIMRAGNHVHYLWGGVDRNHARLRAGEAVQWAVMEWAVDNGCGLYDLEGIDPVLNPGTYQFKKKMGGTEVTLATQSLVPVAWQGQLLNHVMWLQKKLNR